MQRDRIVNEMHTKNPWIGVNGKSNKGIRVKSWILFMDCIELHKLTIFPADAAEKQHYSMQQMIKKPLRVTVSSERQIPDLAKFIVSSNR